MKQHLITNLWFDGEAEEAAKFYTSLFPNSKILSTMASPKASEELSGRPAGSVLTVDFEIMGQRFVGLNGGPMFKFNESVSFIITCDNQQEVDKYWDALTANGGEESSCGWLKDRWGVSWQVVPQRLYEMLEDSNPAKAEAVTAAFLPMSKLDIATLEKAYAAA